MIKRRSPTQQVLRVVATLAAVALVHFIGAATAQTPVKQIKLTEKLVQNFIAAKKDMAPVAKEIQGYALTIVNINTLLWVLAQIAAGAFFCDAGGRPVQ